MKIYTDAPEGSTVVQNAFIDRYMPHASGEFVKVYLYLLRCADTGLELSLSSIADIFEHTEKDVRRALAYWEKQGLLRISLAPDGSFLSVVFLTPPVDESPSQAAQPAPAAAGAASGQSGREAAVSQESRPAQPSGLPDMPSRSRIAALSGQKEIRQLFFIAEQYLQRPLSSTEQSDLVYYYDGLHFSPDLIEYLLEYCISKGSPSRHYMRKVALGWAEAGISTVAQAKQETNLYNKNYYTVLNAFGIRDRGPAAPERDIMSRWFDERRYPIDLVLEACRRTISQTQRPKFEYADSILENWRSKGVSSCADIAALDKLHRSEQKKAPAQQKKTPASRFHNFTQREYDFNQLERQLLNLPDTENTYGTDRHTVQHDHEGLSETAGAGSEGTRRAH